jgi:hypothetical protein
LDGQLVLTRDTVHRVRHVLRSGSVVLLAYAPSVHIGEDVPEGERG